jgi:hypothetical protein
MENPTGEAVDGPVRLEFDRRLKLEFHGYRITSDAGLMACRGLDDALGLSTKDWSPTSLSEKLITIGARIVMHGRYVTFQMAEVAAPRMLFAGILRLIAELRAPPDPAPA